MKKKTRTSPRGFVVWYNEAENYWEVATPENCLPLKKAIKTARSKQALSKFGLKYSVIKTNP